MTVNNSSNKPLDNDPNSSEKIYTNEDELDYDCTNPMRCYPDCYDADFEEFISKFDENNMK